MTNPQTDFDVAIIGFGPTGATLTHLLGMCGLDVLVLEREAAPCRLPRAVHFDDEVMRVFQTIGLADRLVADTRVNPGMRFVDPAGNLLLDWSRPQEVGRHGWHASYRFHQPALELALSEQIELYSKVVVRRRCEAFLLTEKENHVVLRYEDMATGKIEESKVAHVVGCDGARSLVRRFIGSDMEDLGFHERWLVVDVQLKRPRSDLGDHSIQYCDPGQAMTYARQPGNRRRWEIRLSSQEADRALAQPAYVWSLLARWITPDDADIERTAAYTFHSLIARRWRLGRMWIAGDAAHQTPPFMGQGMCAGIRDAANLAWKLAHAVRCSADEVVLESYQSERLSNVRTYISAAVRLGGLINASDPEAALRLGQSPGQGASRMESLAVDLGPGLGSGPKGGRLFGQLRLHDGTLMDDVVGYAMVLLVDAAIVPIVQEMTDIRLITTDDAPDLANELADLGAIAVLLRPDRYILAMSQNLAELANVIAFPIETDPLPVHERSDTGKVLP